VALWLWALWRNDGEDWHDATVVMGGGTEEKRVSRGRKARGLDDDIGDGFGEVKKKRARVMMMS